MRIVKFKFILKAMAVCIAIPALVNLTSYHCKTSEFITGILWKAHEQNHFGE